MAGIFLLMLYMLVYVAALPTPEIRRMSSGAIELSLDDIPSMTSLHGKYNFNTNNHEGKFHKGPDGRWHHINPEFENLGSDIIAYMLTAEIDGRTVVDAGQIQPDSGLVVTPPKRVRRGTLVFRDEFNCALDTSRWEYEVSMFGGYNWEVQAYVPDKRNIYTRNGHLFIKPTLTIEDPRFNEWSLTNGVMDMYELYGYCTNSDRWGCKREGKYVLLPPVMSGKIKSKNTIRFGSVEVRAKTPTGDWIWPAIWMMPKTSKYGGWPASGEIDIMESRGNLVAGDKHGVTEVGATLHWGPDSGQNRFLSTHGTQQGNWNTGFHTYRLDWTIDHIQVFVDNRIMMNVPITESFWQKGGFSGHNIWGGGSKAAPFDTAFYLMLNVAVAGNNGFFPDNWNYNTRKPWKNNTPTITKDFWNGRGSWLPTWKGEKVAMEIDYVQMTQY
ncbi:beta-1,3-glucan-binding protein-like isoform X2 [Mercenaria mercenaria]|nr:beta-1,3-glucan-binding protein-like isoform X2 [Mercenaria mercenaria]